jgi:hypothetical protein
MKIIDIDTGEVIEEIDAGPSNFFTTRKYWKEYKEWCDSEEVVYKSNRMMYEKFIRETKTD